MSDGFAAHVIQWQKCQGRQHLPWQNTRDPYRVWLSEIMLQQTQVSTVLNYYPVFLQRFACVKSLAAASLDEVLGLWSGLGYYSRARNLHQCAQQVVALHGAQFPQNAALLETLPGIGRSTASAIAAICFGERVAILDANVRRVLSRVAALDADMATASSQKALWSLAEKKLPAEPLAADDMPRYTQGLMDLGAMVCLPRRPQCLLCPVQSFCAGYGSGQPENFPVKRRKIKRSSEKLHLLWAARTTDGAVWLERRPAKGIWGSLYCLPVFDSPAVLQAFVSKKGWSAGFDNPLPEFLHVLTHKDLYLVAWPGQVGGSKSCSPPPAGDETPSSPAGWFTPDAWPAMGFPAPVRKMLLESKRQK